MSFSTSTLSLLCGQSFSSDVCFSIQFAGRSSLRFCIECPFMLGLQRFSFTLDEAILRSLSKFQAVSGRLSWSHYTILLGVSDLSARSFYEKQSEIEHWSSGHRRRDFSGQHAQIETKREDKGAVSSHGTPFRFSGVIISLLYEKRPMRFDWAIMLLLRNNSYIQMLSSIAERFK